MGRRRVIVIPGPPGKVLATGKATTTGSYSAVVSYTPAAGKRLRISKIVICAEKALWWQLYWAGSAISSERLMDDKTMVIEHFTGIYEEMIGDGSKAFEVRVKYYANSGEAMAEIVGWEE